MKFIVKSTTRSRKDLVKVKNRQAANPQRTLKRLLATMFGDYKLQLIIVLFMILLSAFANVRGSLFASGDR